MMKKRQFKGYFKKAAVWITTAAMLATSFAMGTDCFVAKATANFTAVQDPSNGNYVHLDWQGMSGSEFMVAKESTGDTIYQTIPLETTIRVLNVYPDDGTGSPLTSTYDGQPTSSDSLKTWMNTAAPGQSYTIGSPDIDGTQYNMTVDDVALSTFNGNPSYYLGSQGNYNCDVIFFGSWDRNGDGDSNGDLSDNAKTAVTAFISAGGGYLTGHDTASFTHSNFISLAETYLNMHVDYLNDSEIPTYGNTQIVISKKGLLMNYPYVLGNVGDVLTTPMSHTYYEFASGDVWFKYNGSSSDSSGNWDGTEINSLNGESGTNNFYLTTWNNCAMIQTGHSDGASTTQEQEILANTLYYLAQTTTGHSLDDHTAQDLNAPNEVSGTVAPSIGSDGTTTISFNPVTDNGTAYNYQLYSIDGSGNKTSENTASATVTTGVAGYAVSVDQNATGDPGTAINATTPSYNAGNLAAGSYYAHIKAIDNAGNESGVSNIAFTVQPTLTLSATAGGTADTTIIGVTGMQSNSDTLEYQVSSNSIDAPSLGTAVAYNSLPISQTISSVTSGEYVGVYEVDSSGNVVAFSEIRLTNPEIGTSAPVAGSGGALSFDGSNYVDLGNNSNLALGNNFTEEVWVYPTEADDGYHGILGNQPTPTDDLHNGSLTRSPGIWVYDYNKIYIGFGDGTNWDSFADPDAVLTPNAWNHVASVYDGNTLYLYINGMLKYQQTFNATPCNTPVRFIGKVDNNFNGQLDEVQIWSTARTQSQIQSDMYRHPSSSENGLVGYWNFDETSGTTAYDSSLSQMNGTLTGDSDILVIPMSG